MKLRAIRLRGAGPFQDGLALEGLTGGLDVLIAPNEAGKSTMFRAVEALFFWPHTSRDERLKRLLSADLTGKSWRAQVEADFTADGCNWRLSKQFGDRQAATQLATLGPDGGPALDKPLKGPEAMARLAALLGLGEAKPDKLGLPGSPGFLWVGQRGAIDAAAISPREGAKAELKDIVAREVASMSGVRRLGHLLVSVQAELAEIETPGTGKPRAAWADAIRRHDELVRALRAALSAATQATERRATVAELQARRSEIAAPDAPGATSVSLASALRALAVAKDAVLRAADAKRRHDAAKAARQKAEDFLCAVQSAVALEETIATLVAGVRDAENVLSERMAALAEAEQAAAEAAAAFEQLAEADALAKRSALALRLAEAGALSHRVGELKSAIASQPATGDWLRSVRQAVNDRQRAEDALAAALPRVSITYETGTQHRILRNGQPLGEGDVNAEPGAGDVEAWPMRLDIPGIGTVTIESASASGRAGHETRLRSAITSLDHLLAAAGVASIIAAEEAATRCAAMVRECDGLEGRLAALAPRGLVALQRELDALDRQRAEAFGGEAAAARPALRLDVEATQVDFVQLDAARGRHGRASRDVELCQAAVADARVTAAALAGRLEQARARHSGIDHLGMAQPSMRDAEAALNAAIREEIALRETVLSPDQEGALIASRDHAVEVVSRLEKEAYDLDMQLQRLMALEEGAAEPSASVEQLQTDVAIAEAAVTAYADEAGGLKLLKSQLEAAIATAQDRMLEPITRRLAPYLAVLFANSGVDFNPNLEITGLTREGRQLTAEALSGGTAEQIGIAVRLAYARVLAENGRPMPVILDDALVYTDDGRLEAMFRCLELAAEHHQVLVLSCQEARFSKLPGKRLRLEPWAGKWGQTQ